MILTKCHGLQRLEVVINRTSEVLKRHTLLMIRKRSWEELGTIFRKLPFKTFHELGFPRLDAALKVHGRHFEHVF